MEQAAGEQVAGIEPFDPSIPELITDPYPVFARIRENDPFHWAKFGYWVVSRYDHVREVLQKWRPYAGLVYFHLLLDGLGRKGLVA